jgi:hypothetical protein
MPRSCISEASTSSIETNAEQAVPIITPISSSATEDSCVAASPVRPSRRHDSRKSTAAAASAPAPAPIATPHSGSSSEPPSAPSQSISRAPTDAPPDRPSTYGSASGLRVSNCINAPASAKAAPAPKPASTRGTRIFQRISGVAQPIPTNRPTTPTAAATSGERQHDDQQSKHPPVLVVRTRGRRSGCRASLVDPARVVAHRFVLTIERVQQARLETPFRREAIPHLEVGDQVGGQLGSSLGSRPDVQQVCAGTPRPAGPLRPKRCLVGGPARQALDLSHRPAHRGSRWSLSRRPRRCDGAPPTSRLAASPD